MTKCVSPGTIISQKCSPTRKVGGSAHLCSDFMALSYSSQVYEHFNDVAWDCQVLSCSHCSDYDMQPHTWRFFSFCSLVVWITS